MGWKVMSMMPVGDLFFGWPHFGYFGSFGWLAKWNDVQYSAWPWKEDPDIKSIGGGNSVPKVTRTLLLLCVIFHYIWIGTFTYVLTKLVIRYRFYVSRAPMHLPCTWKKQFHPLMITMVIIFRENSHGKLKTKGFWNTVWLTNQHPMAGFHQVPYKV